MKKYLFYICFISSILFFHGCNSQSSEENKVDARPDIMGNENEAEEKVLAEDEPEIASIEETGTESEIEIEEENQEDKDVLYKSKNFDLEIQIDSAIIDNLIIEENPDEIQFLMEDKTLIKDNILLGMINIFPRDMSESLDMHNLLKVDSTGENVFAYFPVPENPYVPYKNGEELLLEEKTYAKAYYLLQRSLIHTGFLDAGVFSDQELPASLDQNQEIGIEISEGMLQDIKGWYQILKDAMDSRIPNDEWIRLLTTLSDESYNSYPEIRQIPFPTFEIGQNISSSIFTFHEMDDYSIYGEEVARIETENTILSIGNNIELIETQIEEIINTYQ